MPTFTTIALDRLLEQGAGRENSSIVKNTKEVIVRPEKSNGSMIGNTTTKVVQKKHHWTQISPALYTTPVATPVPDIPSSFPPSPYIINHKRRGESLARRAAKETSNQVSQDRTAFVGSVDVKTVKSNEEKDLLLSDAETLLNEKPCDYIDENCEGAGESVDFFDPLDSLSRGSYSDGEDSPRLESSTKLFSPAREFFDAPEELSSDGGTSQSQRWQAPPRDFESELCEMKLALLAEIEQRKQAEDDLQHLRCQWLKLREHLSSVGITLPADFPFCPEDDRGNVLDVSEQINIARFVSETVGRGIAKAEAEKEMEVQLELKNFEISRLNDRLNYYEAVNQEMCQRNQEVMESARQLRQRRNRRQTWVWGSLATAITLGSTALAWKYLPAGKGSSHSGS